MFKSIDEAVCLMESTLCDSVAANNLPYFFIVGAGLSAPEIYTSSKITEECIKKIKLKHKDEPERIRYIEEKSPAADPMEQYSYWIEKAYPNKQNRSDYFRALNNEAKISAANILLAKIIVSRKVATTVFSTNFDDKLEQALSLMGATDVFVADSPQDNLGINDNYSNIQIAHVHGTYHFYDCANLKYEIDNISKQAGLQSPAQALQNFFRAKAAIIVGYSGWENDVIMTCLKQRLSSALPYNYIWVCYSIESFRSLPIWLRESKDIWFVCLEEDSLNDCDKECKSVELQARGFSFSGLDTAGKIPAISFLGRIISDLRIETPLILENPYKYYSDLLQRILPEGGDVLKLRRWAEKMKYLGQELPNTDRKIDNLELEINNKNAYLILYHLKDIFNDDTFRLPEVKYIFDTALSELIADNTLMENTDFSLELTSLVLGFIRSSNLKLIHQDCTVEVLGNLLFIFRKSIDQKKYFDIVDQVVELTSEIDLMIDVHLKALGVKSSITRDDKEAKAILKHLLDLAEKHSDNIDVNITKCIALSHLAMLSDDFEDACTIWNEAYQLSDELQIPTLGLKLISSKIRLAALITENEARTKWIVSALEQIRKFDILNSYEEYLLTYSNSLFDDIDFGDFSQTFNNEVVRILRTTIDIKPSFSHCEVILGLAKLTNYHIVHESLELENSQIHKIIKIIHGASAVHRINCLSFNHEFSILLVNSLGSPCDSFTSLDKINSAKTLQNIAKEIQSSIYVHSYIERLMESTDENTLLEAGFKEEVEYIKLTNKLSLGFEAYLGNNLSLAEICFFELIYCSNSSISSNARIDLAYMIRRGECTTTNLTFCEVINAASNKSLMKHINIFLYNVMNSHSNFEVCLSEFKRIQEFIGDLTESMEWWGNEKVVGTDEYKFMSIVFDALSVEKFAEAIESAKMLKSEIFDANILKELLLLVGSPNKSEFRSNEE